MKKYFLFLFAFSLSLAFSQPPNNLSGLKFCIDPGHGGNNAANDRRIEPDPGNVFWESEGNFQKALLLRPLLQAKGATVLLTRETNSYPDDSQEPTLTERWQFANENNVNWFHSIHSNAGGGTYTMVLVKENISTRQVAFPQAITMSSYIYNNIRANLRTTSSSGNSGTAGVYLDYTFYGGANGGYNLGVLKGLAMPGELSEGSFHDGFPETRRLLNNFYRKMEAYAIMNGMLQYNGCPKDSLGIIAGIQLNSNGSVPVNQTKVRLLPENRIYTGDSFNNGFYMFDSIQPGQKIVRFETPGFSVDSVVVNVTYQSLTFADRTLYDVTPPKITLTQPVQGDTNFSVTNIIGLKFSMAMDTASVRAGLTITPDFAKTFLWTSLNSQLVIKPSQPLPTNTNFTITIAETVKGSNKIAIDGNGDGTAGDEFVLHFKTGANDLVPPTVTTVFPVDTQIPISPNQVFHIQFSERIDPSTITPTNIKIETAIGGPISGQQSVKYWDGATNGAANIFLSTPLQGGGAYRISISNIKDLSGNKLSSTVTKNFTVISGTASYTIIDDFNSSVVSWWQPTASGSTVGAIAESSKFAVSSAVMVPFLANNTGSAQLKYGWNTSLSSFLLREYLGSGEPRNVKWYPENTKLQTYVLGDGNAIRFRFAIDDSVDAFPSGTTANHEVSPWYVVDWLGWRLVEWDFKEAGAWLGNKKIEGQLRFDSYQLQYIPDTSAQYGTLYFDNLQVITQTPTSVKRFADIIPTEMMLEQNYPNPFNPTTTIAFSINVSDYVSLKVYDALGREVAVLVNENLSAGNYSTTFNASSLASGVYMYRLSTSKSTLLKRMLLVK